MSGKISASVDTTKKNEVDVRLLILLTARQNLRQYYYAKILEKLIA